MAFSYIHEYHCGNFADLQKHICLSLILDYLGQKEKPFTVIDTHAAAGIFNLGDERILKTGEAKEGIQKLYSLSKDMNIPFPEEVKLYISKEEPYLQKNLYAGSPELERLFLRKNDAHFVIEKHPQALASLEENMTNPVLTLEGKKPSAAKTKVINQDSFTSLKSLVPPLVKRGLIICDPSFEDQSDYGKVTQALIDAHKKWNTAIIALWYPLITRRKNETSQMLSSLENAAKMDLNPCESFRSEMIIKDPAAMQEEEGSHLYGSGMFVMNPPWTLKEKMEKTNRFLEKIYTLF